LVSFSGSHPDKMRDPTYVYNLMLEQRRINKAVTFLEKMKGLKPDHNLGPDVAFVAILHHDKLPVDQFDQHDALWIKCPKDKEVASLLKAYKKRYQGEGDIVLRHDFQVIEEKTKVTKLATRPPHNFIAIEAVPRTRPGNETGRSTFPSAAHRGHKHCQPRQKQESVHTQRRFWTYHQALSAAYYPTCNKQSHHGRQSSTRVSSTSYLLSSPRPTGLGRLPVRTN